MTDLEITKLCAEAMGFQEANGDYGGGPLWFDPNTPSSGGFFEYYPLLADSQAMELLKNYGLQIEKNGDEWLAEYEEISVWNEDLNRAICECVAKMQAAKKEAECRA